MLAPCVVGILLATQLASAQSPDAVAEDDVGLVITAESSLVAVPLHVYKKRTSVDGLGAEAFALFENGAEQQIAFVEGPGTGDGPELGRSVPIEIVLLLDISHSVLRRNLLDARTIQSSLLEDIGDSVSISVYGFAGKLRRFAKPTNDPERIQQALDLAFEAEAGGTRVYESIVQTARDAAQRGASATRMMVVFSDGMSTTDFSPELSAAAGNAYGIPIYPVVLGHQRIIERAQRQSAPKGNSRARDRPGKQRDIGPPKRPVMRKGTGLSSKAYQQELRIKEFADLGAKTGGRSYDLKFPSSKSIRKIFESLATLARTEYVVGYYPRRLGEEATTRTVEVRLKDESVGRLYGGRRVIVH